MAHIARSQADVLDEMLVLRCQQGDGHAVELLVGRWQPRLLRQALRLTGDLEAASDAVQEAWLAIVRGLGRLHDPARFRPWAYQIVSRKCTDWVRRRQRRRRLDRRVAAENGAEAAAPVADDRLAQVRRQLRLLPSDRRAILSMHYVEGMSVREIAEVLSIPEGTVKSRLFHARNRLRDSLEESTDDST